MKTAFSSRLTASTPIQFFLGSLGVHSNPMPTARFGPFETVALSDSPTLRRAAACLPKAKKLAPQGRVPRGWILLHAGAPLGLLIETRHEVPDGQVADFAFLDFSELMSCGPEPDAVARAHWGRFKTEYFAELVKTCHGTGPPADAPSIGIDAPTGEFRLCWSVAKGGRYGNVSIPLFLDVFTPATDFVPVLLECALPKVEAGQRVLVLGCGAGPETVLVALSRDVAVDAVDIGELEVANARASVACHDLEQRARVWQSDAFSDVPDAYDTILFNAPVTYEVPLSWGDSRAADQGGRTMLSVLSSLDAHLRPGGALYVMAFPDRFAFVRERASHLSFNAVDPGRNSFRIYEVRPG